jgi:UDP-N-acetylmuramate--alanine ligase
VTVSETTPVPDPRGPGRYHFAGLAGSGMSAIAQFHVMLGGKVSGSDRSLDRGERAGARKQLEALGIEVYPQDGSGLDAGVAALVVSTAVEDDVPDVAAARKLGIRIVHRSDVLAHHVAERRTIAVTGTSGKSTVVAMVFEILRAAGKDPSVMTGGDLEADESDGSVVRYEPAVGVILNLQRDHREMAEVAEMFDIFRSHVQEQLVVGDAANLARFAQDARLFGFAAHADVRGESLRLEPESSSFEVEGRPFRIPVPGLHNIENALAAITACRAVGVELGQMAEPLAHFRGVGRRFQRIGRARGVEVIDDFAHNPAKIHAAVETARRRAQRILAVYQPHGYGPTRFLRDDLVRTFAGVLGPDDRLWMLEVFYAGGTTVKDFSAADLIDEIGERRVAAEFAPSRKWLVDRIGEEARSGDLVLIMGARDPSLTDLAKQILERIDTAS